MADISHCRVAASVPYLQRKVLVFLKALLFLIQHIYMFLVTFILTPYLTIVNKQFHLWIFFSFLSLVFGDYLPKFGDYQNELSPVPVGTQRQNETLPRLKRQVLGSFSLHLCTIQIKKMIKNMPKMPKEEIKSQTKELITKDTFSMGMICLTNPILQHLQV